MTPQNKPVRAENSSENEIGKIRERVYAGIFGQITKAEENGFYLEAITLYESLITDRLESVLSVATGTNYQFKNLGPLIDDVKKYMPSTPLASLVIERLDAWRISRNKALHQMAKLQEGQLKDFDQEYLLCEGICREGKSIFRAIDKEVVKEKARRDRP